MTENELRQKYVNVMISWKGKKESNGSHKSIIDLYNTQNPLPRGHKMTYNESWCAATVSAAAIEAKLTSIIPLECSCSKLIELAKSKGIWQENDKYVPKLGDLILYDWDDKSNYATTDDTGAPEHVGVVTKVSGNNFTVTEGNKNDAVGDRAMKVNGKYIRGFICPRYYTLANASTTTTKTATGKATKFDKKLSGTYTVTSSVLNMRNGAGTKQSVMVELPKGTTVKNYGYYSESGGVKWLYVQTTIKNVRYTGFCSSQYLRKA